MMHRSLKSTTQLDGGRNFEKDGKPRNKVFTDSLDNTIFIKGYYNGNLTAIDIDKAFSIKYFPDGKVMSMIIRDEFNREMFGQYYYRNGRIRRVVFQNIEKKNIASVDFTDTGEILNRSTQSYLNPDSLLPNSQIVNDIKKSLSDKLMTNSLFTDSILNGSYELFYSLGKPMARLNFKDDLPHGDFVFFYPLNGDTLCYKYFESGIPSDFYINNFAGTYPLLRGKKVSYVNDGYEERFRQNGVIETKRVYSKLNKQLSESSEYFENGKIKSYQKLHYWGI